MRQIDGPAKFPIPFANGAGGAYIRAIPQGSQIGIEPGAASLTDGFPPVNFNPVSAGGIPPDGRDHNGILQQITAWIRAMTAGIPIMYDAAFQTAIGGYPANAWIRSAGNPALIYQSTADNNMSNPDSGGANWTAPVFIANGLSALIIDGHLSTSYGAGIQLFGTGGTPNKWLRAINGNFSIVNNAYSAEILTLTDGGALSTASSIVASTGNVSAPNGSLSAGLDVTASRNGSVAGSFSAGGDILAGARLRAVLGARGSGDLNAAPILADFSLSPVAAGYQILPNGFIIQWGQGGPTAHLDVVNFPIAFPNACLAMAGSENGVTGWDTSGTPGRTTVYGFQVINNAQFYMSCVQIDIYSGPLKISYVADFGKWIAVGY
jgi:hypothetical protein